MDVDLTGIPGLDSVTGGLPPHGLTMVIGPPGTGKTVLSLQVAAYAAGQGRDVIFLSLYSEPHEKVIEHMRSFSFFDPTLVGDKIQLLSMKNAITEGTDAALSMIFKTARGKNRPLVILDGYRGFRNVVGPEAAQEFVAALSIQMPYHSASAIVASESSPHDDEQYTELASADAIITLSNQRSGAQALRWIEVLKMRGHGYREGVHSMVIRGDGITVYPRLATSLPSEEPSPTGARQTFGLPAFDQMLDGGLPEFSSTLIFGEPGTGKTTFAIHYLMEGAAEREKSLLVTFRESRASLLRKAQGLGLDMAGPVNAGQIEVFRVPPVELNLDELAWHIREMVDQRQVKRLVIDGVVELERAANAIDSENSYVAALSEYVRRSGTTSLLLQDGGPKGLDVTDMEAMVPVVQNRIILRRVEFRARLYRICSVLNMQDSDHDTSIREFQIGQGGIQILSPSETEPGVLAGIAHEQPIARV